MNVERMHDRVVLGLSYKLHWTTDPVLQLAKDNEIADGVLGLTITWMSNGLMVATSDNLQHQSQ